MTRVAAPIVNWKKQHKPLSSSPQTQQPRALQAVGPWGAGLGEKRGSGEGGTVIISEGVHIKLYTALREEPQRQAATGRRGYTGWRSPVKVVNKGSDYGHGEGSGITPHQGCLGAPAAGDWTPSWSDDLSRWVDDGFGCLVTRVKSTRGGGKPSSVVTENGERTGQEQKRPTIDFHAFNNTES